jgi:hypothetical protein
MLKVRHIAGVLFLAGLTHICLGQKDMPLPISIEISEPVPVHGDDIHLKIVTTNISDREVHVTQLPGGPGHAEAVNDVELRTAAGVEPTRIDGPIVMRNGIATHQFRTPGSRRMVFLQPGEKLEDYLSLNKLYDLSTHGSYKIFVKQGVYVKDDKGNPQKVYVESNTVDFTIPPS